METSTDSEIVNWYSGQNILITGGTGFMGKILIEKLLRSCPDVAGIYLLVRSKKGKSVDERLEDILNSPVFDKIRDEKDFEAITRKLHCIHGDIVQEKCHLTDQDEELLKEKISVVFHMAANVRFDQHLKNALLLNTGGTMNVLEMVKNFKNLKVFLHVSTSYCHCEETVLEEKLYPSPHDPRYTTPLIVDYIPRPKGQHYCREKSLTTEAVGRSGQFLEPGMPFGRGIKMLDMAKWLNPDLLKSITPQLLNGAPNTYAYTKCLTEQLVSEYAPFFPIVITRPSVVTAVWKEPIPGWVDNLNGPTGILVGAGKGVIRTMHCNADLLADLVPVDVSINSILIIAWKVATSPRKPVAEVYHITADRKTSVNWGEALEMGKRHFFENPFSVCLWYPGGSIKRNYFLHVLAALFFHTLPAYIVDFFMILLGNKPFLVRIQQRIHNGLAVLQYYTTRAWYFHNEKLIEIFKKLNKTDRSIFYVDLDSLNMDQYILNYVLGARKYCVHEEPETIPHAKKVLKRLYYIDLLTSLIFYGFILWILIFVTPALLYQKYKM